jgi:hypothetical protein
MNKLPAVASMNDALGQMTTNVQVGMDEVCSVFVAKYEQQLLDKKAELSARIKGTKAAIEQLTDKLLRSVDKSAFEGSIPGVGIKTRVEDVTVQWEKTYYTPGNSIVIEVKIEDTTGEDKHVGSLRRSVKIPSDVIDSRKELQATLESENAELLVVMDAIKSISRKERQIRGRIAEMKLENSGMSALINNPELLKLVQL